MLLLSGEGTREMPLLLRGIYKPLQVYKWVYIHYFIIPVPHGRMLLRIKKKKILTSL